MPHQHMDRMTSFDASFLSNEVGAAHMTIGAVLVCEGSPPDYEDFLTHIRSRLHLLPRLRQRLAFPPLGLGRPFWVDDSDFDIDYHVRRTPVTAPGTDEQFRELIGEALSPPLDRRRPLWELRLVEGLEGDRFAVVYKTHHAMADGISAVDIGTLLFDLEPVTEPVREEVPWQPNRPPSGAGLLGESVRGLGTTAMRLLRWLGGAARAPRGAAQRAGRGIAGVREVAANLFKPAPAAPFNVVVSEQREFRWAECDLDDCKLIKDTLGGTINDVALAAGSGALRRWLQDRGVDVSEMELQALVPVSIRAEDEHTDLGNRLTAMRGPLPVHEQDPVERLRIVAQAMAALKTSKQPYGAEAIWGLNDWFREFAPPLLLVPTARINFSTRLFNLLLTNFPGPQVPFYVLGRELTSVHPIGFLANRHALAIAIFSYNGRISFGLLADPSRVKGLDSLERYLKEAVAELRDAAGAAEPASAVSGG